MPYLMKTLTHGSFHEKILVSAKSTSFDGSSENAILFAGFCWKLDENHKHCSLHEKFNSTITRFIESRNQSQVGDVQASAPVRIILPFKDQKLADVVRRQPLSDLGEKINSDLRPVFTSKKIGDDIKVAEAKPPLINQQCVVYKFNVICVMRLYLPTPFPTHWRIQTLWYWKTPAWRPQSEEQRCSGTVYCS